MTSKNKILIVEDEPSIVDTIQYALESEGFETLCLAEGLPVLSILEKEPVSLIVLDIGLPDISGFELCKQIRQLNHGVPVIFLTARGDEIDRVVGLEIGGDDYVTKPFSPRELTARVRAVLRRTAGPDVNHVVHPAFHVDESRRIICYFGRDLDLSLYEFRILLVFIGRPGHVFSRSRLMDVAWDEPETSMDRTVDTHIKNIRAKLRTIRPEIDPIITHRGVGYSLKEAL